MGCKTEFNWYLVQNIHKCDDIEEAKIDEKCFVSKDEERMYPIGGMLPFIIKEKGCLGLIKIDSVEQSENLTGITFHFVKKYSPNDVIAKHYWDMYMSMKKDTDLKEYDLP